MRSETATSRPARRCCRPAERIDQVPAGQGERHGVHREIAPAEIVLDAGSLQGRDVQVAFGGHHPVGAVACGEGEPGSVESRSDVPRHLPGIVLYHDVQVRREAPRPAVPDRASDQPTSGPAATQGLRRHLLDLAGPPPASVSTGLLLRLALELAQTPLVHVLVDASRRSPCTPRTRPAGRGRR